MMLALAILALPALLRFVVPATSALTGAGAAGAMLAGAAGGAIAMRLPAGAARSPDAPSAYGQRRAAVHQARPSLAAAAQRAPTAAARPASPGQDGRGGEPGGGPRPHPRRAGQRARWPALRAVAAAPGAVGAAARAGQAVGRQLRDRWFRRTGRPSSGPGGGGASNAAMAARGRPARPGRAAEERGAMATDAQTERTYGQLAAAAAARSLASGAISSVLLSSG